MARSSEHHNEVHGMTRDEALNQIAKFEAHYRYDSTYMRELLNSSPEGFAKFNNFMPLSSHRERLSLNDYWIAKLATMQVADCGECLQLNVRMAIEAGVPKALVQAAIHGGDALPDDLKDVFRYATSVARNEMADRGLMDRMTARYDKGALLEFGMCIAAGKVFPTIKRALGYTKACNLMNIEM